MDRISNFAGSNAGGGGGADLVNRLVSLEKENEGLRKRKPADDWAPHSIHRHSVIGDRSTPLFKISAFFFSKVQQIMSKFHFIRANYNFFYV